MNIREERTCGHLPHRGFAGLLRSLLDGIPWSDRAELEETVRIDAAMGGVFRVHNANGRIQISGEDRTDIQVTALKAARAESTESAKQLLANIQLVFNETADGVELEVNVPRKWNRRGWANLSILIPKTMSVSVDAANGRVDVEGIRAPVRARSTNGSANVADIVGDVEVATTNAKVSCARTRGKLIARSCNGKIEIERHRGSVDASTSNGLIRAELDAIDEGGVQLATSNGRIVLNLPEELDADVDLRVDNGTIRNDRTLEYTARETDGCVVGRIGAGGTAIKLRTSNGSISIH